MIYFGITFVVTNCYIQNTVHPKLIGMALRLDKYVSFAHVPPKKETFSFLAFPSDFRRLLKFKAL